MQVACVTMARNESCHLRIWYSYYSRLFGASNCFIIDHCSDKFKPQRVLCDIDGADEACIVTLPIEAKNDFTGQFAKFDITRFRLISNFVEGLLNYYNVVIYNDTDEIYIVDPERAEHLRDYIQDKSPFQTLAGVGVELLHDYTHEQPYIEEQPLLSQRNLFVYRIHYSKPHIVSTPCKMLAHGVSHEFRVDPFLFLVHLKYFDKDYLLQRQKFLNSLYLRGIGGGNSRWRLDDHTTLRRLDKRLRLPRAAENFTAHRSICERPAGLNREKMVYEMQASFNPDEKKRIQSYLNSFPPRFEGLI